jgi:hypothetical protein
MHKRAGRRVARWPFNRLIAPLPSAPLGLPAASRLRSLREPHIPSVRTFLI